MGGYVGTLCSNLRRHRLRKLIVEGLWKLPKITPTAGIWFQGLKKALFRLTQVIDVLHPSRPNVSKAELKEKLERMYDLKSESSTFVFKFRTHFGGGMSIGFGLIYDYGECKEDGLDTKVEKSRKQLKVRKNRAKKILGVKKSKAGMLPRVGRRSDEKHWG
ncbi:hypothetical protein JRO89_XS08G0061500 [Xanthoceras sorbifolium]|uniref:40S ribosomal protein S24 n=1 Tax=Xanthoceras sorbifolium TaxID=99658 RepID=A0ABQ8HNT8_9ROSI|nr:hypothetical protein JRO89_XS08G0061500 [Xanthoceras sorbifolium]